MGIRPINKLEGRYDTLILTKIIMNHLMFKGLYSF